MEYETLTHVMSLARRSIKEKVGPPTIFEHGEPWRKVGMSIPVLANTMNLDAYSQVEMLTLLCNRLDDIIRINDQRKVCRDVSSGQHK
jgi:hypothetical protein